MTAATVTNRSELEQVLDTIPQPIAALGTDGKVLYVNRTVLKYTGLELEDVNADDFPVRLFHPEDLARTRDIRRRALEQGVPFDLELRTRCTDGGYRWCHVYYEPLRDVHGLIVRWYATAIEDRERSEERITSERVAFPDEIARSGIEEIVGSSDALCSVLRELNKVALTDSTVLITGETGTGKELVARAIHRRSVRSAGPFISLNCAAIPAGLIASELFGHERGAFTGALQQRKGRFELAAGGTIFLDEVSELSADAQATLLRVLQEREFERVGGHRPIRADVRVIAATNRDLHAAVGDNGFRADLFFRLSVFPLELPPLRDRVSDIPLLVDHFVQRLARREGKTIRTISRRSLDILQAYPWPGNIRELQNVIERAVIVVDTDVLRVDERWLARRPALLRDGLRTLDEEMEEHERSRIEGALATSQGTVHGPLGAAARLGIPRSTLESRIRALGIDKYQFKGAPPRAPDRRADAAQVVRLPTPDGMNVANPDYGRRTRATGS